MKRILSLCVIFICLHTSSCTEKIIYPTIEQPDYSDNPKPLKADNNVVAHRGAFKIKGAPQNSIASLKDAIDLKLFAVEADIQLTSDGKVVIYHDPTFYGKAITKTTYDELIKLGTLSNGEQLPLLEDFIQKAMDSKTTKLWLDVKMQTDEYGGRQASLAACLAAMEIAREKKALYFVEFLITNEYVMHRAMLASKGSFQLAYQVGDEATTYPSRGYGWASQADERFYPDNGAKITEFLNRGVKLSIYMADNVAKAKFFLQYDLYGITSNDPELVLKVTRGEL